MSDAITIVGGNLALAGRPVLRGIDLRVGAGEVVAVLGANGSGKSTLIRGLMGLAAWSSGEVRLFGVALGEFRDWRRVGYVPQRVTATSGVPATVTEVVASGRLARRRLLMPLSQSDRAAVRRAISAVELEAKRSDAVSQLSGGQQQRVLIARALATEPDLFVLDEPNAGVDQHNQTGLVRTLRPLVERGAAALIVLHELGPLADLIDRVVVLREGRIGYDGPPERSQQPDAAHGHHHPTGRSDNVPISSSGWSL